MTDLPSTGQIIALRPYNGTPVVCVTSVNPDGVNPSLTYESSDGHSEIVTENLFLTLPEQMEGWRLATTEEQAKFLARHRPAPQNWS